MAVMAATRLPRPFLLLPLAAVWLAVLLLARLPPSSASFSSASSSCSRPSPLTAAATAARGRSRRALCWPRASSFSLLPRPLVEADPINHERVEGGRGGRPQRPRERRRHGPAAPPPLFSSSPSGEGGGESVAAGPRRPPGDGKDGDGGSWRNHRLLRLPRRVAGGLSRRGAGAARRLKAWFRGLSSRARLVVAAQLVALCLAVAAAERGAHVRSSYGGPGGIAASRRSIEVSYSSFLDLVEQQQQPQPNQNRGQPPAGRAQAAGPAAVPVMDQVRIGADRIVYRLHRPALAPAAPPSTPVALGTSLPSDGGTAGRRTAIPPRLLQRQRRAQQQRPNQQAPGFVTAYTRKVSASPELVRVLRENGVPFAAASQAPASVLGLAVRSFLATLYFMILWRLYQTISGATGGGGMGGSSLKDSPGKLARASELPLASFDDIQGIDDSKQEVMELVDTLRNPEKYAILGARAPTGLLLEGPPGTGKTMLARATAASAGVPLLYCSGSDFVEMFVGRGAARVRKLFERAERLAPCIIFIDELDALGKARSDAGFGGVGMSRSNDEAEQTLNQLLACMDGLDSSRRICVLAATNRKDVLDNALIRPGRFDRIVKLRLPDARGRESILRVHCRKLPGFREGTGIDPGRPGSLGRGRVVDLSAIAAVTDGFSGAELEFLVNEAAIRAVRRVSSALRQGVHASDITPHVDAQDFESSLVAFYDTRRPKSGVNELWKSLLK